MPPTWNLLLDDKVIVFASNDTPNRMDPSYGKTFTRIDQSIAMGALFTAYHLGAKAIVALTDSGSTAPA